jgi:hypothetical protein
MHEERAGAVSERNGLLDTLGRADISCPFMIGLQTVSYRVPNFSCLECLTSSQSMCDATLEDGWPGASFWPN